MFHFYHAITLGAAWWNFQQSARLTVRIGRMIFKIVNCAVYGKFTANTNGGNKPSLYTCIIIHLYIYIESQDFDNNKNGGVSFPKKQNAHYSLHKHKNGIRLILYDIVTRFC